MYSSFEGIKKENDMEVNNKLKQEEVELARRGVRQHGPNTSTFGSFGYISHKQGFMCRCLYDGHASHQQSVKYKKVEKIESSY